jgi:acetylornithine deacetylase/succinyl-diaminopimelate desuccinylase-like protein
MKILPRSRWAWNTGFTTSIGWSHSNCSRAPDRQHRRTRLRIYWPGRQTILPHRAVAKFDLRLVPNMIAKDALAALKAHLEKRGFVDIEVNMTGGYDPTTAPQKSALIGAQAAV